MSSYFNRTFPSGSGSPDAVILAAGRSAPNVNRRKAKTEKSRTTLDVFTEDLLSAIELNIRRPDNNTDNLEIRSSIGRKN